MAIWTSTEPPAHVAETIRRLEGSTIPVYGIAGGRLPVLLVTHVVWWSKTGEQASYGVLGVLFVKEESFRVTERDGVFTGHRNQPDMDIDEAKNDLIRAVIAFYEEPRAGGDIIGKHRDMETAFACYEAMFASDLTEGLAELLRRRRIP